MLLARELLPEAWLAPEDIQRLRDQTRLRKTLTDDHTRWAQRLHALLVHEGWPCSRGSLLTDSGRRWVAAIRLHPGARVQINTMLAVMATLAHEIDLYRLRPAPLGQDRPAAPSAAGNLRDRPDPGLHDSRRDRRRQRFRRARQVIRAAGLDPVVRESADKRRRGHLAKQGAPMPALGARRGRPARLPHEQPRPRALRRHRGHAGANPATLSVARKIGKRAVTSCARSRPSTA